MIQYPNAHFVLFRFRWTPFPLPADPCASSPEVPACFLSDAPLLASSPITSNTYGTDDPSTHIALPNSNEDHSDHYPTSVDSDPTPLKLGSFVASSLSCSPPPETPDCRDSFLGRKPIEPSNVASTDDSSQQFVMKQFSVKKSKSFDADINEEDGNLHEFARYQDLIISRSSNGIHTQSGEYFPAAEQVLTTKGLTDFERVLEEADHDEMFASVDDLLMEEEAELANALNVGSNPIRRNSPLAPFDKKLDLQVINYTVESPPTSSPQMSYVGLSGECFYLNRDAANILMVEELLSDECALTPPRPSLPCDDADDERETTPPRPMLPASFDTVRLSRGPSLPTIPEDEIIIFSSSAPLLSQTIIFTSSSLRPDEPTQQTQLPQTNDDDDESHAENAFVTIVAEDGASLEQPQRPDDEGDLNTASLSGMQSANEPFLSSSRIVH